MDAEQRNAMLSRFMVSPPAIGRWFAAGLCWSAQLRV